MEINEKTFNKIAHLARLKFSEEEKNKVMDDMSQVLTWVEKLNEVDTTGVEPLITMSKEKNAFREDEIARTISKEKGLKNSPDHDNDYFRVTKVIK